MRRLLLFLALLVPGVDRIMAAEPSRPPTTAVLGAMAEEIQLLESEMQNKQMEQHLGLTFYLGVLRGRPVVLARAGVGKVNAASTITLVLDHYRPNEVLFTGIAGGVNPDLLPGDIVIGEKTAQHDYGHVVGENFEPRATWNPINGKRNPLLLAAEPSLVAMAEAAAREVQWRKVSTSVGKREPRVVRGVIVTGDVFVASLSKVAALRRQFQADAVEMEGAAVAQVCAQQGVPCLIIRSLSDKADSTTQMDLNQFGRIACSNSASLTLAILHRLATASP